MTSFTDLQERLIELVRARLRNGQITERGLARRLGVSQPHLHNVLKRVRELTPQLADQILGELQLSLKDLIVGEGNDVCVLPGGVPGVELREVPLMEGALGPGHAWTGYTLWRERLLVPASDVADLELPAFARLAYDARMSPLLDGCTLCLLDLWNGKEREQTPLPSAYYAVLVGGECRIRRVRALRGELQLVTESDADNTDAQESARLGARGLADVILARVRWAGREPRAGVQLGYSGCFLGPMTSR